MCALSVGSCRKELEQKFTTASSEMSKLRWRSKVNLLDELMILRNMPLHLAYDEYMAKIPLEMQAKYKASRLWKMDETVDSEYKATDHQSHTLFSVENSKSVFCTLQTHSIIIKYHELEGKQMITAK